MRKGPIYAVGLDYGTNSMRAATVNTATGREVSTAVRDYEHGDRSVILGRNPNLARQPPADDYSGCL